MDMISDLPDDILFHTLSFLSTKEAALTSLLSKRWHNLFALTPHLCLEQESSDTSRSFCDFVDRVLAVSGNSPIKKLSLRYPRYVVSARVNLWISNMLSRGGLHTLHLDVFTKGVISLPLDVFAFKTLFELRLGIDFKLTLVPGRNATLPALKNLFLEYIRFSNHRDGNFGTLLSCCVVLERLTIHGDCPEHWEWCRTISCPTLRRLTIRGCDLDARSFNGEDFRSVSIDTPNLSYLNYKGRVADEYPVVNFDSLVQAKLFLRLRRFQNKSNPTNFIKGLKNVKILHLSTRGTCEIFESFGEAIPMLKNLSRLSIKINYEYWRYLPLLLSKTPNLRKLAITGPSSSYISAHNLHDYRASECPSGYSFLVSCPVKVIEITNFWGSVGEFSHLERLLEKLPRLELVKITARARDEKAKLQLTNTTDLLMLPRACKIQLRFTLMPI